MKKILLSLTLLLALSATACAESLTIGVTLTIPSVPGLNAPPLVTQAEQKQEDLAARESKIEEALAAAQQTQNLVFAQAETAETTIQAVYER